MDKEDPNDYTSTHNTLLSPFQELAYQSWAERNNRSNDTYDYDLRGFWKDNQKFSDNNHGSDKYKKPNHPTFSDESMYHGMPAPWGGKYQGGTWSTNKRGETSYTPSATMLKYTHNLDDLMRYMQENEPDVRLNMDRK